MNWRALLAVVVLVGICLGCLAALDSVSRALRDRSAVALPPIDYVLDDVSLTRHREGGDGRMVLTAQRVIHHRESQELDVRQPRLSRLGGEEAVLVASASHARVHGDNDRIDLSGGVQLERTEAERHTVLNTATLQVQVKAQTAQTADPVEIREGTSILTGRGLQADLNAARYQILADLKARYVPVSRTPAARAGLDKPLAAVGNSAED